MPLSRTEIKARSVAFARDGAEKTREIAEAKSFWDAFFNVFNMSRRAIADFPLKEFHRPVKDFAFIAGYKSQSFIEVPAFNRP